MQKLLKEPDYDCGLLNDYGGGNIEWWQCYIRAEVGRCNGYWRSIIESHAYQQDVQKEILAIVGKMDIYRRALESIAGLKGPLTGEDAICFRTWAEEALEAHKQST